MQLKGSLERPENKSHVTLPRILRVTLTPFKGRENYTLFTQPALFVWVEECVHQVIAVILRNLERLFLNAIVQTLQIIDIHSIKHFLYLIDIHTR